jgi:hypothetical protein
MSKSLVQPVPKLSNTKLGIKNTMAHEKQDLIRLQHDYLDQFTKKFLTEADIGSKILVYTPVKNLNPINAYYDPKHPNYPLNAFYIGTLKEIVDTKKYEESDTLYQQGLANAGHRFYIFTDVKPFFPKKNKKVLAHGYVSYLKQNIDGLKSALLAVKNDPSLLNKFDLDPVRVRYSGTDDYSDIEDEEEQAMLDAQRIEGEALAEQLNARKLNVIQKANIGENTLLDSWAKQDYERELYTYRKSMNLPDMVVNSSYMGHDAFYVFQKDKIVSLKLLDYLYSSGILNMDSIGIILEYIGISEADFREYFDKYINDNKKSNASSTRKLLTGGIKRRHKRNKTHKRKTRRA